MFYGHFNTYMAVIDLFAFLSKWFPWIPRTSKHKTTPSLRFYVIYCQIVIKFLVTSCGHLEFFHHQWTKKCSQHTFKQTFLPSLDEIEKMAFIAFCLEMLHMLPDICIIKMIT